MTEGAGGPPKRPGRLRRMAGGAALVAGVWRSADRQLTKERPDFIWPNRTSERLKQVALRLAADGREDDLAVRDLREAAGRDRKDLLRAAADIRFHGPVAENARDQRANRLLIAAATGEPMRPLTDEDLAWFQRLDALRDTPTDEAFLRLASLQPGLLGIERRLQEALSTPEFSAMNSQQRDDATWDVIVGSLRELVGPDAKTSDPLVRTQLAFDICEVYLDRKF